MRLSWNIVDSEDEDSDRLRFMKKIGIPNLPFLV